MDVQVAPRGLTGDHHSRFPDLLPTRPVAELHNVMTLAEAWARFLLALEEETG